MKNLIENLVATGIIANKLGAKAAYLVELKKDAKHDARLTKAVIAEVAKRLA